MAVPRTTDFLLAKCINNKLINKHDTTTLFICEFRHFKTVTPDSTPPHQVLHTMRTDCTE